MRKRPAHYFTSNSFRLVPAAHRPGHPAAPGGCDSRPRPRLSLSGSNLNPSNPSAPATPPATALILYTTVTPRRATTFTAVDELSSRDPGHKPNANRIRHSYTTRRWYLRLFHTNLIRILPTEFHDIFVFECSFYLEYYKKHSIVTGYLISAGFYIVYVPRF